jgi:hypothetical protein
MKLSVMIRKLRWFILKKVIKSGWNYTDPLIEAGFSAGYIQQARTRRIIVTEKTL